MATKRERTVEELREEWERVRHGPMGPRERFVAKESAGKVLAPADLAEEVQIVAKARKRLESMCCNRAAFEAVWERGESYYPKTPCECLACRGKRKWPAYYVVDGISLECLLDEHAEDPFNVMEIGYRHQRVGAIIVAPETPTVGRSKKPSPFAAAEDLPAKRYGRPVCESCCDKPRLGRLRFCGHCLPKITGVLKDAGWPPKQTKDYLSIAGTFGEPAAA